MLKTLNAKNDRKIYIISNIKSGGACKYINDIIINYTHSEIIIIDNKSKLIDNTHYMPHDIIFLQHFINTDIQARDVIKILEKYQSKLIITMHDFVWLKNNNNEYGNYCHDSYLKKSKINIDYHLLLNNASLIICNSTFTKDQYNKLGIKDNIVVQENNDILVDYSTKRIPHIKNKIINIGNFQEWSEYKGKENVESLMKKYKFYNEYTINFFIVGDNLPKYDENNWSELIENYNIHGLLHLNKWGETYSYALTKSINSGLPILYNNFGAFKNRIPKNVEHYVKVCESEDEYSNDKLLFKQFELFLDYIINNNGLFNKCNYDKTIVCKELYNFLFDNNLNCKNINNKIFNRVKPFAIYFPQFHRLPENDKNYYDGMTDVTNLEYYNKDKCVLDEPLLNYLELNKLTDYNLINKDIVQKQIATAKEYCIYGFASYYYWFSKNTITNKNTIMEKCYNLFFEDKLDNFKIFFIWANEDWSNNPAFNTTDTIINEYNQTNFIKNIDNLIKYFKHDNYYKIDNKPVFYIHHPYLMKNEELIRKKMYRKWI